MGVAMGFLAANCAMFFDHTLQPIHMSINLLRVELHALIYAVHTQLEVIICVVGIMSSYKQIFTIPI